MTNRIKIIYNNIITYLNKGKNVFVSGFPGTDTFLLKEDTCQNNLWKQKDTKKIIGLCGLHHAEDSVELSYMFFSTFWKKGFAREAATACIDYGFNTLKINKIIKNSFKYL